MEIFHLFKRLISRQNLYASDMHGSRKFILCIVVENFSVHRHEGKEDEEETNGCLSFLSSCGVGHCNVKLNLRNVMEIFTFYLDAMRISENSFGALKVY